jgi:monoamine oxidase
MPEPEIAVIGAGAAGIAAARRLHDAGVATILLEARDRIGGRAWTCRYGSLTLDLGCGWLHSADSNEWVAHAETLGFAVDDFPPPWARPAYEGNFSAAEQKAYWEAWRRFYARIDVLAQSDGARPMSDCFEPGGRFNALLGAMVTYVNGAEAEHIVLAEYARYRDSGVNKRLARGYGALIEAYAAGLDVRLGCPVTRIDRSGARLLIATPRGELSTRAAIVAVPPGVLANETLRFSPSLPDKIDAAARLPLGLADKVFLRVENADDLPKDTRVFGSLTTIETGAYTLRPFGQPIVEGYFGGAFARRLEHEGGFAPFAIEQLRTALGNDIAKRLTPIAESAWARDPFALGAYSYGAPGAQAARAKLVAPVDGRLFFAGEHCSERDFSTAHGAYRSGVQAADQMLEAPSSSGRRRTI